MKHRISKLEKDNQPKSDQRMSVVWGDAEETPAEKAKRIAERPTHDENGVPIEYIDLKWGDESDA